MKKIYYFIALFLLILCSLIYIFYLSPSSQPPKALIVPPPVPIKADDGGNVLPLVNNSSTNKDKVILYLKETKGYPIKVTVLTVDGSHTFNLNKYEYGCDISNYLSTFTDYSVQVDAVDTSDPFKDKEHGEAFVCVTASDIPNSNRIIPEGVGGSMTYSPDFRGVQNERYYFSHIRKLSTDLIVTVNEEYDTIDANGQLNHITIPHDIANEKIIFLYYKPTLISNYNLILISNGRITVNMYYHEYVLP